MPNKDIKKIKLELKPRTNQLIVAGLLVFILAGALLLLTHANTKNKSIVINGNTINIELADTEELREKGLSGRQKLESDQGLLLAFKTNGNWKIWMKDMNFPIDIVWINEQGKVVGLKENASPSSFPEIFSADQPSRYVLELASGSVAKFGIKPGDEVNKL